MGSSLFIVVSICVQAYAIAAWGEIIYIEWMGAWLYQMPVFNVILTPFSYGICLNLKKSDMETKSTNEVKG